MNLIFDGVPVKLPVICSGEAGGGGVPIGTIVIWSGTAENIPTGWALCDGEDGRPDLRDKFVLGAGETHKVGSTGGAERVTLVASEMPRHGHTYNAGSSVSACTGCSTSMSVQRTGFTGSNATTGITGNNASHENMPPYYTLCYIIKVANDGDAVTSNTYSTEEQVIGTWIDGKSVYRKVIPATSQPTTSGTYTIATNAAPDMDTLVSLRFTGKSTKNVWCNGCWTDGVLHIAIKPEDGGTIINMAAAADWVSVPIWLVVEYTKTTD